MDNTAYLAATNQMSALRRMDVLSNNVANSNTAGFKQDGVIFDKHIVGDKDKTSFVVDKESYTDLSPGPLRPTNMPFDMAIVGPGFFKVNTPGGIRYTRDGAFSINAQGTLVNSNGYSVLSNDNQEITFTEGDDRPLVSSSGIISVADQERGQIGITEFDNPLKMRKVGNNLLVIEDAGYPAVTSRVAQGMLEESNVNTVAQMANLIKLNEELVMSNNMIGETYSRQRSAFRTLSKLGGN